jgi:hypothetical protein
VRKLSRRDDWPPHQQPDKGGAGVWCAGDVQSQSGDAGVERCPSKARIKMVNAMKLKPPMSNRKKITVCPKLLQ